MARERGNGIAPATEARRWTARDRTCSLRRSTRRRPRPDRQGLALIGAQAAPGIEDKDDEVGLARRHPGPAHAFRFERIVGPANPCVDDRHRIRRDRSSPRRVARRPRTGDDRSVASRSQLNIDDLPTLVAPDNATRAPSLTMRPRRPPRGAIGPMQRVASPRARTPSARCLGLVSGLDGGLARRESTRVSMSGASQQGSAPLTCVNATR